MGSWVTYGLGSENENLPGFVVLISSGVQPNGGKSSFGSGFLPSVYQGVQCRSKGDPVLYASDPPGMDRAAAPRQPRRPARSERDAKPRAGPSRNADADRPIRAGFPHADVGARGDGHLEGNQRHARRLRGEPRRRQLRQQLPAGPAAGRARRAFRATVRLGLGFPRHRPGRRHPRRPDEEMRHDGPPDRRADQRPQTARPAGRHADRLRRRVRPHAVPRRAHGQPAACWAATIIPIASRCGWPAAA